MIVYAAGACDLIGLGRSVVLQPDLPSSVILNPAIPDELSFAMPHHVRGQWIVRWIPIKVVGSGLPIQFFYYNIRRLGKGLPSQPFVSIPYVMAVTTLGSIQKALLQIVGVLSASMLSAKGPRNVTTPALCTSQIVSK